MWADDVLEQVREAREAHAASFGFDLRAIVEDIQRREREGGRDVVQPPVRAIEGLLAIQALHRSRPAEPASGNRSATAPGGSVS